MKKIAVIGTGGTGYTVAAELSLRGFEVWLCDATPVEGEAAYIEQNVEVKLTGAMEGTATVRAVTNDPRAALADTQLVICCTISNLDEQTARFIAPHLCPGSAVLISAGNLGALIYHRVFQELGVKDPIVGDTCGNLFSCRRLGDRVAFAGNGYSPKKVAAFPVRDTGKLVKAFEGIYELIPASSLLETTFNAPNLLSHISLTIVNAGAIENAKEPYYIFKQGICRSTLNLADGMWAEKKKVMDALGLPCAPSPSGNHRKYADPTVHQFDHFKNLIGPDSMSSRYITEDIPILGCFFLSMAKALGVETPLYAAMVKVAEAINQTPYYQQGRTLENLGLNHLRGVQLIRYFEGDV